MTVYRSAQPHVPTWAVKQCSEKTVQDFWLREFAAWSKNDQAHNVNSSLNKIRRFQSSPILRRILGQQRSRIDFARAINDGQILIFDFDKWRMQPVNANTLASLIVSRLIYAATHRPFPQVGGKAVTDLVIPFHIYIDEFQSVTSLAMVEALSGIRKFRVGFTLCHQYTDQLSPEVLDAVKGNVGTKLVFRVGGTDADQLHQAMGVSEPQHLSDQADYEFTVSMKQGNNVATHRAFSLPHKYEVYGHGASIQRHMQTKFAKPVAEIDAQYERWQNSRHYGGVGISPSERPKQVSAQGMKSVGQFFLS